MTMRNDPDPLDSLLKKALHSSERPAPDLLCRVKSQPFAGEMKLKRTAFRNRFGAAAATAMLLLLLATTAFAAWYLKKPAEVAGRLENRKLASAFEEIEFEPQSATGGGYVFTLLGVVSGKDITDHPTSDLEGKIYRDRTYAVVAIGRGDGPPPVDEIDVCSGFPELYISPYIRGLEPWLVNAHTLHGGYTELTEDDVVYRIIDCDQVTIFADKGVYLGVSSGICPDRDAFIYDHKTGVLAVNQEYGGISILFDLPLDRSLADPEKAQHCLEVLRDEVDPVETGNEDGAGIFRHKIRTGEYQGSTAIRPLTYQEYKIWAEDQLAKTLGQVEQGKYSKAAYDLDRLDHERNIEKINRGAVLYLFEYGDGIHRIITIDDPDGSFKILFDGGDTVIIDEN